MLFVIGALMGGAQAAFECPAVLKPLCDLIDGAECFAECAGPIAKCVANLNCQFSLAAAGECMAGNILKNVSAQDSLTCLIPDNLPRDDVFLCLMDDHDCIPVPQDGPIYPACRDTEIKGDPSYDPKDMIGDWWKVKGWIPGEPYECRNCSKVNFWNASLPYGPNSDDPDFLVISSVWREADSKGKYWDTNDTSLFGPRDGHKGYPNKVEHIGAMFGLRYLENFTVIHAANENEPFAILYGCGGTKQGVYTTGLVLARTPTISDKMSHQIDDIAAQNGFDPKTWCTVDNSCPPL